jgi:hypothetical protein
MACATRYQTMKNRPENGLGTSRYQLVNHAFLRGLEGSHVITADDPDGSTRNPNQKG